MIDVLREEAHAVAARFSAMRELNGVIGATMIRRAYRRIPGTRNEKTLGDWLQRTDSDLRHLQSHDPSALSTSLSKESIHCAAVEAEFHCDVMYRVHGVCQVDFRQESSSGVEFQQLVMRLHELLRSIQKLSAKGSWDFTNAQYGIVFDWTSPLRILFALIMAISDAELPGFSAVQCEADPPEYRDELGNVATSLDYEVLVTSLPTFHTSIPDVLRAAELASRWLGSCCEDPTPFRSEKLQQVTHRKYRVLLHPKTKNGIYVAGQHVSAGDIATIHEIPAAPLLREGIIVRANSELLMSVVEAVVPFTYLQNELAVGDAVELPAVTAIDLQDEGKVAIPSQDVVEIVVLKPFPPWRGQLLSCGEHYWASRFEADRYIRAGLARRVGGGTDSTLNSTLAQSVRQNTSANTSESAMRVGNKWTSGPLKSGPSQKSTKSKKPWNTDFSDAAEQYLEACIQADKQLSLKPWIEQRCTKKIGRNEYSASYVYRAFRDNYGEWLPRVKEQLNKAGISLAKWTQQWTPAKKSADDPI